MTDTPTIARSFLEPFGTEVGEYDRIANDADWLADQLVTGVRRVAAATCTPGNGTRYDVVVSRLTDEEERAYGGSHLVSLPTFGTCGIFTLGGLEVPDYVGEKLKLRGADAAVVATILTLIGHRLNVIAAA